MTRQQRRSSRKAFCRSLGHAYFAGWFNGTTAPPTVQIGSRSMSIVAAWEDHVTPKTDAA